MPKYIAPLYDVEARRRRMLAAEADGAPTRFRRGGGEAGGRLVTIGGALDPETGKRRGGSPVFLVNGVIVRGNARLTGRRIDALQEVPEAEPEPTTRGGRAARSRKERVQEAEYQRARWAKQARKQGINPKHLHQLAAEIIAHDREHVADRKAMLKQARQEFKQLGTNTNIIHANDRVGEDDLPGLDVVGRSMMWMYPEQFAGVSDEQEASERLLDMLKERDPQPMGENAAYAQALEIISAHQGEENAMVRDDEPVPFGRGHRARPDAIDYAAAAGRERPHRYLRDSGDELSDLAKYAEEAQLDLSGVTDAAAHVRTLCGSLPAPVVAECQAFSERARRRREKGGFSLDEIAVGLWPAAGRRQQVEREVGGRTVSTLLEAIRRAIQSGRPWPTEYGEMMESGSKLTDRSVIDTASRMRRLDGELTRYSAVLRTLEMKANYRDAGADLSRLGRTVNDLVSPQESAAAVDLATRRGWLDDQGYQRALAEIRRVQ